MESAKPYFYPNPANGTLLIKGGEAATLGKLYLCNAYGKVVFTSDLNSEELTIDTRAFPSGVYVLKVVGSELMTNDRVLINHESSGNTP